MLPKVNEYYADPGEMMIDVENARSFVLYDPAKHPIIYGPVQEVIDDVNRIEGLSDEEKEKLIKRRMDSAIPFANISNAIKFYQKVKNPDYQDRFNGPIIELPSNKTDFVIFTDLWMYSSLMLIIHLEKGSNGQPIIMIEDGGAIPTRPSRSAQCYNSSVIGHYDGSESTVIASEFTGKKGSRDIKSIIGSYMKEYANLELGEFTYLMGINDEKELFMLYKQKYPKNHNQKNNDGERSL